MGIAVCLWKRFQRIKKYKLIITFVEEITEEEDIRAFASQSDAFAFWENEEADLYQDFLPQTEVEA